MTEDEKSSNPSSRSVPSHVELPDNKGYNQNNRSNRSRKSNNSSNSGSNSSGEIDRAFRNDSSDLGVMYQRYFDCSSPNDQIHFTNTQEKLSLYVGEHYKPFGRQFKAAVLNHQTKPSVPAVSMPKKEVDGNMVDKAEGDLTFLEKLQLKEKVSSQQRQELELSGLKETLFNFIYGRCTELLQDRIKAHSSYNPIIQSSDPFDLLSTIREIVHKIETNAYMPMSIDDQLEAIYRLKQGNKTVCLCFCRRFHHFVEVRNLLHTLTVTLTARKHCFIARSSSSSRGSLMINQVRLD